MQVFGKTQYRIKNLRTFPSKNKKSGCGSLIPIYQKLNGIECFFGRVTTTRICKVVYKKKLFFKINDKLSICDINKHERTN